MEGSGISARVASWRRVTVILASMLALLAVYALPVRALGASTFDATDGNMALDDDDDGIDDDVLDWENAPNLESGLDPSGKDDDSYKGGAKHDSICPAASTGSIPPNKDNLTRFSVSHETVGNDVYLYLSWQRFLSKESSASAHMGFEFNKSTTPCGGDSENVLRTAGDMLIIYDLEGGGAPVLSLMRWLTSLSGTDSCEAASSAPCWGNTKNLSASGHAEGSINTTSITDPINGGTLPFANQFGEAAVNLTAAGVFSPETCEGFGRATLGSRSSGNSFVSTLKDYIGPIPVEIQNCGVLRIEKEDDNGDPLGGASFSVYEDDGDEVFEPGTDDALVGSCTTTADGTGDCEFEGLFFAKYWIEETQAPPGYDITGDNPRLVPVTTPTTVTVTFVNPLVPGDINVAKTDDDENPLAGATFTLYEDTTNVGNFDDPGDTSTGLTCTTDTTGTCIDAGDPTGPSFANIEPGFYCVVETVTPAGYGTADPQCFELTLGSESGEGATVNLTFVDPRLHKIIVIVCHEGTDTLAPSDVSNDGDSLTTIGTPPGGVSESDLCSMDGFGGKDHASEAISVDVGSDAHD